MNTYATLAPCGLNELNGLGAPFSRAPGPDLCPPDCPYRNACPNRPPEPVCPPPPPAPRKKSACNTTLIALALAYCLTTDCR